MIIKDLLYQGRQCHFFLIILKVFISVFIKSIFCLSSDSGCIQTDAFCVFWIVQNTLLKYRKTCLDLIEEKCLPTQLHASNWFDCLFWVKKLNDILIKCMTKTGKYWNNGNWNFSQVFQTKTDNTYSVKSSKIYV